MTKKFKINANASKILFEESQITLFFAKFNSDNYEEENAEAIYEIAIPANLYSDFVGRLIVAGMEYEKEFNKDIGFNARLEIET